MSTTISPAFWPNLCVRCPLASFLVFLVREPNPQLRGLPRGHAVNVLQNHLYIDHIILRSAAPGDLLGRLIADSTALQFSAGVE